MPEHSLAPKLRATTRVIALGVATFGALGLLLGWRFPVPAGESWLPSLWGALFLLLSGVSLLLHVPTPAIAGWRRWRKPLAGLAGIVVLLGGLVGISDLGVYLPEVTFESPVAFDAGLLASMSLLLLQRRGWSGRLGWLAATFILSFALFVLIDYLYTFRAVDYVPIYEPLGLSSAVAYALLGVGLLLTYSAYTPARLLQSPGPGGFMVRRLLLPALGLPLLLLWLLRVAVRNDLLGLNFGYSLVSCVLIISLIAVICYQARVLDGMAVQARRQLAQAEQGYLRRIELAVEAAEFYLWEAEPQTGRTYHTAKYIRDLGYEPDEVTPHIEWWSRISEPDDLRAAEKAWQRLISGEIDMYQAEHRVRRKQGDIRWMYARAKVVERDPQGHPLRLLGVLMDITDRKAAEQRLADTQAKLKLAMDIASVGYWEMDPRTQAVYYSPEWKRLLGYADDEIASDRDEWLSRLHPDDRDAVLKAIKDFQRATAAEQEVEFRLRHKDGGYRWIASRAVVNRDKSGVPIRVHGVHLDITERKQIEDRIRRVSQHDPLTGLPNRALIHEFAAPRLASARRGGSQLAVLFIDMDRFKPINDQHGHEAGDEVLKEIARRLRSSVRESDLVGRLGGDEFVLVLTDVRSEEAAARVARLCIRRLDRPYRFQGLELRTSPSIGISLFPRDGGDIDTLIRNADAAMYEAKHKGRNTFQIFRPEFAQQVR